MLFTEKSLHADALRFERLRASEVDGHIRIEITTGYLKERYEELFQSKPRVVACHAGLECGILGQHYPDMDMISFGPTILGAHSPDERVSISSVQNFWKFLKEILQHIPEKE